MREILCKIFGHIYFEYRPLATSSEEWAINSLIVDMKLDTDICKRCGMSRNSLTPPL